MISTCSPAKENAVTLLAELSTVSAFFSLGIIELVIIALVLLFLVGVPVVVVCLVVGTSRRSGPPNVQYGDAPPPDLVACPDCGHSVSRRAESCPNCGAPIAGKGSV
jgi:hypothetical protein